MLANDRSGEHQLLAFVAEREAIRRRKEAGQAWPWTDDPVLREWSFCNVRREDDRVTRWIALEWRDPHSDDPDLFVAMAVARLINSPATLAEIGWPLPWSRSQFLAATTARRNRGEAVFGPAYVVGTAGKSVDKLEYVAGVVEALWAGRLALRPVGDASLAVWHARLERCRGLGSFMAAQIVADVKYAPALRGARDWWTFAASGPGSRRGLNRVLGRQVGAPWREHDWRSALRDLHQRVAPDLDRAGVGRLHAQDLQNCLCEFDKERRATLARADQSADTQDIENRTRGDQTHER